MSVGRSDYTDHTVLLYDTESNHLSSTTVTNHDKTAKHIQVSAIPKSLKANDDCKLLILSSPTPREYLGKVKKIGGDICIALFQGQEKEKRTAVRYPVITVALINALVVDEQSYALQTPIRIELINISTSGIRFRAPYYSLVKDDVFKMNLIISNNKRIITAKVTNYIDNDSTSSSDYGCQLLGVE